jgi:lysophospholipase-2
MASLRLLHLLVFLLGTHESQASSSSAPHKKTALVVFLHGLGDRGSSFKTLFRDSLPPTPPTAAAAAAAAVAASSASSAAASPSYSHIKWVFPTAATIPVTINGGARMPGWYDIVSLDAKTITHDVEGLERSYARVAAIIDDWVQRDGGDPRRVVLGGFSQGAAVALYALVRGSPSTSPAMPSSVPSPSVPYAGILGMSGYLPMKNATLRRRVASDSIPSFAFSTPVRLFHGANDQLVAPLHAKSSAGNLDKAGFDVKFKMFKGVGHHVSNAMMKRTLKFVLECLPPLADARKEDGGEAGEAGAAGRRGTAEKEEL